MTKTISNILTGVATLYVRQPNDAIAQWSTEHAYAGTYSAKLTKVGTGNDGSTHLQIIPPAGETMTTWLAGCAANEYTYYYYYPIQTANWIQAEFRFEDQTAGSEGWAEITCVPHQGFPGTGIWAQYDLVTNPVVGFGGWGTLGIGQAFFDWDLGDTVTTVVGTITGLPGCAGAGAWALTRVRFELWEAADARSAWVDSVEINGVPYTVEPGGTAPAMSFSSPFTEVGYTEDGVNLTYNADVTEFLVEEETLPIDAALNAEGLEITCNMAENTLANMANAMAGAVLSGNILTIGGGVLKTLNLKIEGITPAGFLRAYQFPKCYASGSVGMSYRKAAKVILPVTFKALKDANGEIIFVDNAA